MASRSSKRSGAGFTRTAIPTGPVIDAEWTPVEPSKARPAASAPSAPLLVRPVRAAATASAACRACGRPVARGELVTVGVSIFTTQVCRQCAAVGKLGLSMLGKLFG